MSLERLTITRQMEGNDASQDIVSRQAADRVALIAIAPIAVDELLVGIRNGILIAEPDRGVQSQCAPLHCNGALEDHEPAHSPSFCNAKVYYRLAAFMDLFRSCTAYI